MKASRVYVFAVACAASESASLACGARHASKFGDRREILGWLPTYIPQSISTVTIELRSWVISVVGLTFKKGIVTQV